MLTFTVVYKLREYLSVLREFARIAFAAKRAKAPLHEISTSDGRVGPFAKITIAVIGSIAFFYKKRKIGTCVFSIDEASIKRSSKLGELEVLWEDVRRVHRFQAAYLFLKTKGGMPIPYRCLTPTQRDEMERLLTSKGFAA